MLASLIVLQDDGLTIAEILRDLPHDAGAVVVYALVAAFVVLVWRGSRKTKEQAGGRPEGR